MAITCPIISCQAANEIDAVSCVHCGVPLSNYTRLVVYPSHLFNQALVAARQGQLSQARDLFAAVVYWCPLDLEARNALAMACYVLHDWPEARRHWEIVKEHAPSNAIALKGLAAIKTSDLSTKEVKRRPVNARQPKKKKGKKIR